MHPLIGELSNGADALVRGVASFCCHMNFRNSGGQAAITELYFAYATLEPPRLADGGDESRAFHNPPFIGRLPPLHVTGSNKLTFPPGPANHRRRVIRSGNAQAILNVFTWIAPIQHPLGKDYATFSAKPLLPAPIDFGNRLFYKQAIKLGAVGEDPKATSNDEIVWATHQVDQGGAPTEVAFIKPYRGVNSFTDQLIAHLAAGPSRLPRVRFVCDDRPQTWDYDPDLGDMTGYTTIRQGAFKQLKASELRRYAWRPDAAGALVPLTADQFADDCEAMLEDAVKDFPSLENVDQFGNFAPKDDGSRDDPIEVLHLENLGAGTELLY